MSRTKTIKPEKVALPDGLIVYYTMSDVVEETGMNRAQIQAFVDNGTIIPDALTNKHRPLFTSHVTTQLRENILRNLSEKAEKLGMTLVSSNGSSDG